MIVRHGGRVGYSLPLIWLVLLASLALGCASSRPRPPIVGGGIRVRQIELQGVTRFSKGELLSHLHLGETRWIPFTPDFPHEDALLAAQARRIEELYRSYGYHRARVEETTVRVDDRKRLVDLTIRVEEGPVVRVTALRFRWSGDVELPAMVRAQIEAQAALQQGGPFEVARLDESVGSLRQELLVRGYPLAVVSSRTELSVAALAAEVELTLVPGPQARVGGVEFEGLRAVPAYLVARETEFALGQLYSPALVRQIEDSVKALRVFRWVATRPPVRVEQGQVTLVVRLSEAAPQSIGLGARVSFETNRWQQQARAIYTHTNLFGNLTRLDLTLKAGWAELPNPLRLDAHGPMLDLTPSFTKKGLLEKRLLWTLEPRFQADIQEGYQYWTPSNRVGVSRWLPGPLSVSLTHNWSYVDFFNLSPTLDRSSSQLGRDFRDPFALSYLELKGSLFRVDSINSPRNGVILETTYHWAGGLLGGGYSFHKFLVGARGYLKPFRRLQLATRLQTGLILPYGEQAGAPFSFKYYLGGANSVRGWGSRRLSPRLAECVAATPDAEPSCDSVPVGGLTMIQGNLEGRLMLFGPVVLVGFLDLGDVQADEQTYVPAEWNWSAGPGLRADTPLGLVRLDLGFRLNDPGLYPDEPSWAIYFGLGEAF